MSRDVADWLRGLGLGRYVAAFRDNEIDWEALPRLTAEDLSDLGVVLGGHRRRLLDAIAALGDRERPIEATRDPMPPAGPNGASTVVRCRRRSRAAPADPDVLRSGRLDAAVDAL